MDTQRRALSAIVILAIFATAAFGQAKGKVYLVLGSDTAIWEGMNTDRYADTYNLSLYTDPSRNAYAVMDPAWRNQLRDALGTPMKLTWWMMAGNIFRYATNTDVPIPNTMTMYLMQQYHGDAIRQFADELTLHYHTFVWNDYDGDGKYWWNQAHNFTESRQDFDFTLAQYLLEHGVFPVSFRSGWHAMDNEWQHVLDEILPYSMHNDYPAKRTDPTEPIEIGLHAHGVHYVPGRHRIQSQSFSKLAPQSASAQIGDRSADLWDLTRCPDEESRPSSQDEQERQFNHNRRYVSSNAGSTDECIVAQPGEKPYMLPGLAGQPLQTQLWRTFFVEHNFLNDIFRNNLGVHDRAPKLLQIVRVIKADFAVVVNEDPQS